MDINVRLVLPDYAIRLLERIAADTSLLKAALFDQRKEIMATLDETLAAVEKDTALSDGIVTLVAGLKKQLQEVLTGVTLPPAVQAKVDAVFQGVTANNDKVEAALLANTGTGGEQGPQGEQSPQPPQGEQPPAP